MVLGTHTVSNKFSHNENVATLVNNKILYARKAFVIIKAKSSIPFIGFPDMGTRIFSNTSEDCSFSRAVVKAKELRAVTWNVNDPNAVMVKFHTPVVGAMIRTA